MHTSQSEQESSKKPNSTVAGNTPNSQAVLDFLGDKCGVSKGNVNAYDTYLVGNYSVLCVIILFNLHNSIEYAPW